MTMTAPNQHEHLFFLSAELGGETLATQLTSGEWNVSTSGINVDTKNKLIYFQGNFFVKFLADFSQNSTFQKQIFRKYGFASGEPFVFYLLWNQNGAAAPFNP